MNVIVHKIILILALVGIATAIYLFIQRVKKRPPVCVIDSDCATVWESPYSKTFGVGNEVFGFVFYATSAAIELALFLGSTDLRLVLGELVFLAGGFVMSCYFIYLQWRVIRAWCFWCTFSAVIVWAMLTIRLVL